MEPIATLDAFKQRLHLGAQITMTFSTYKYQYKTIIGQTLTICAILPNGIEASDAGGNNKTYIHLSWNSIQLTEKGWRHVNTWMGKEYILEEYEWVVSRAALTQDEAQHIHERIQSALLVIKDALDEDDVYEEAASGQVERCDDALRFSGAVLNDITSFLLKHYALLPPQLPETTPLETAP